MSIAARADLLRGPRPMTPPVIGPAATAAAAEPNRPASAQAPAPNRFADLLRQSRTDLPPAAAPAAPAAPSTSEASPPSDATENGSAAEAEPQDTTSCTANPPGTAARARAAAPKGGAAKTAVVGHAGTSGSTGKVTNDSHDGDSDGDGAAPAKTAPEGGASSPAGNHAPDPLSAAAPSGDSARPAVRTNATVDDGGRRRDVDADPLAAAGTIAGRNDAHARAATATDAAADRHASLADSARDSASKAAGEGGFRASLASLSGPARDPVASPTTHERSLDALAAVLGNGAASRAEPQAVAPAALAVTIATPVDGADFATAFGVQVSVLAQDGVQQAELHLNPAEMGPVSIHISLDGSAARVDFAADVAATRHAIERGLPELAGALRDAGFTLAGGGVSSHAGARSGGEDDAARSPRRDGGAAPAGSVPVAASSPRASARIQVGGIDLYA